MIQDLSKIKKNLALMRITCDDPKIVAKLIEDTDAILGKILADMEAGFKKAQQEETFR